MGKLTDTGQLISCAQAAKDFTDGRIGDMAGTVADAISELAGQLPATWQTVTLPAGGWSASTDITDYGYSCTVSLAGVTAADSAESVLQPGSITAASDCGLCAIADIGGGGVTYYAKAVPASDISMQVRIIQGLESDNE